MCNRDQQIPGIDVGLPNDDITRKDYIHRDIANRYSGDVATILASRRPATKRKRYKSQTPPEKE